MKKCICLFFLLGLTELNAMDYCNVKLIHQSHVRQNTLLRGMFPVEQQHQRTVGQSELSKKMFTSDVYTALVWSLFTYAVIDDFVFYLPFDVEANIRYNQKKLSSREDFDFLLLKKQVSYLINIFYATCKMNEPSHEFSGIRSKEEAISLLSSWFLSNGNIAPEEGVITIKVNHVEKTSESVTRQGTSDDQVRLLDDFQRY
jgi:hypothetical protein